MKKKNFDGKSKRSSKKSKLDYDSVLVVLGCAPNKDGHPSSILLSRIETATKTYRKGYFDKVILSGGPTKYPIAESDIMAVFFHNIVPKERLLIENRSLSTIHNALFVWELVKDKGVRKMTIVTSDFHVKRARHIFEKIFEHAGIKLDFVPARATLSLSKRLRFFVKEFFALRRLKVEGIR